MSSAPRRRAISVDEHVTLLEIAGRRLQNAKATLRGRKALARAPTRYHGREPSATEARAQARGIKSTAGSVAKLDATLTNARRGRPNTVEPISDENMDVGVGGVRIVVGIDVQDSDPNEKPEEHFPGSMGRKGSTDLNTQSVGFADTFKVLCTSWSAEHKCERPRERAIQ